jgi:hypothetical protein
LSFQNVALKYHYPVGLLYDLFSGSGGGGGNVSFEDSGDVHGGDGHVDGEREGLGDDGLPWKLEFRYSGFPEGQLMRLDEDGLVLRDCFVNAVKEVSFSFSFSFFFPPHLSFSLSCSSFLFSLLFTLFFPFFPVLLTAGQKKSTDDYTHRRMSYAMARETSTWA